MNALIMKPLKPPPKQHWFARGVFLVGLVIFTCGICAPYVLKTNLLFNIILLSGGLSLMFLGLGESAPILKRKYNIPTAAGLFFTIAGFMISIPYFSAQSKPPNFNGQIEFGPVGDSDAIGDGSVNDVRARITYGTHHIDGKLDFGKYVNTFNFEVPMEEAQLLERTTCPIVAIWYNHAVKPATQSFLNSSVMPSSYNQYFHIVFNTDSNKFLYYQNHVSHPLPDCQEPKLEDVVSAKKEMNNEKSIAEFVPDRPTRSDSINSSVTKRDEPPATGEVLHKKEAPPSSKDTPPAVSNPTTTVVPDLNVTPIPSPVEIAPKDVHIVGYVIFSQLNPDTGRVDQRFYDVDGRDAPRAPLPGDKMTLTEARAVVRLKPFSWDERAETHTVSAPVADLYRGQTVVVAGDSILARDESRHNSYYVITPISEIVGTEVVRQADYPVYEPNSATTGYVYLGYFDGKNPSLADASFDNYSSPNAVYPNPGDLLVARSDIWLRAGPRHWDPDKEASVMPRKLFVVHKGDYVRVAGDIVLTGKGISYWAPIKVETEDAQPMKPDFFERVSHNFKALVPSL